MQQSTRSDSGPPSQTFRPVLRFLPGAQPSQQSLRYQLSLVVRSRNMLLAQWDAICETQKWTFLPVVRSKTRLEHRKTLVKKTYSWDTDENLASYRHNPRQSNLARGCPPWNNLLAILNDAKLVQPQRQFHSDKLDRPSVSSSECFWVDEVFELCGSQAEQKTNRSFAITWLDILAFADDLTLPRAIQAPGPFLVPDLLAKPIGSCCTRLAYEHSGQLHLQLSTARVMSECHG